jgi:spermidine synthase
VESREAVDRQVKFGKARLAPAPYHPTGWVLMVDGAAQSYVDLADPTYLRIPYIEWFGRVLDLHWPAGEPVSAIQVGGGGFTIARYLAATRPGSPQTVYELDGPLVDLVRSHLDLDAIADLQVRVEDGEAGIERTPDATADVVVMDVARAGFVAVHLAAVEFLREIARVLRPGGLYLGNMWCEPDMTLALRAVAALTEVFPHVALLAKAGLLLGKSAGNVALVASDRELPHQALTTGPEDAGNRVFCLSAGQLAEFRGVAPPLTADHPAEAVTPVARWTR